jgi:ribonuclease R
MIAISRPAINTLDIKKYSHPIPNRNYILGLLKDHATPLNKKQLASLMELSGSAENEALRRRLRAMERDGQIAYDHRSGYSLLRDEDLVLGRVIGHRDGFGFLAPDEGGDDLLLNKREMLKLFDGDRVLVRIRGTDRRGRKEALLVKVIEHNTSQVVGQLRFDKGDYYIKPESSRIAHEIDIDKHQLKGAKEGQYVVVKITDYPCHKYNAYGKVTEVLGDAMAPGMEIEVAIREHEIPYLWPNEVMQAATSMGEEVSESDKLHRVDLRELPFVTIDGDDARDFDDAVYCEQLPRGGWHLRVAIADVSHYVTPDSPLDREAQKRGTSVYFPQHVVPMLPEALSNGLCSLNPNVDRLVMVCEMTINTAGKMTDYQFSEAVIHSHARLTYNEVDALLTSSQSTLGQKMHRNHAALVPHITALHQLYGALRKARTVRGSIDFETQETQFQFNKERKVDQILPVIRNDAHKLIEECMLCANVATARFLEKLKLPALYRNHKGPQQKKLKILRAFLGERGLNLSGGDKPSPIHYDDLLSSLGERSDASVVQVMMLRSLSQAEYSPDNEGHFGLAYSAYSHFTSPIRRYPDLLMHRAIRSIIRGQESGGKFRRVLKSLTGIGSDPVQRINSVDTLDPATSYPYDKESMHTLAAHCSQLSRRADKASWDVDAWLKCEYMRDAVGEVFTGAITTVASFGLFVELADTKIEGLIHITSLNNDFYRFDEAKQCLTGERTDAGYTIGDTVCVRVVHVDMEQRKIEFELADLAVSQKKRTKNPQKN